CVRNSWRHGATRDGKRGQIYFSLSPPQTLEPARRKIDLSPFHRVFPYVNVLCSVSMIRSSRNPMRPIVNTATMILLSDSELPFWNSSQTNFPSPGFCASISAAISTIQPTPSERRMPVKMYGSADGSTSFVNCVVFLSRSTFATLSRSLSIEATRTAVLMTVAHNEHSVTVTAELMKDFSNNGSA